MSNSEINEENLFTLAVFLTRTIMGWVKRGSEFTYTKQTVKGTIFTVDFFF